MMAIVTNQTELGYLLPAVSKQMSIEMFKSDIKTIHNDQEAAEREGLPAPIAVGPQTGEGEEVGGQRHDPGGL